MLFAACCCTYEEYPTLAPPGGFTLHIEKLLNSSFSINLLLFKELQAIQRPVQSGTGQSIDVLYTIQL